MTLRPLLRDLALLTFAAGVGWWAHTPSSAVHANTSSSIEEGSVGFQFGGAGLQGALTLYSPASHTLYVYPANSGSSHINCAYSIHVERFGGPIERTNCPIGSAVAH